MKARIYVNRHLVRQAGESGEIDGKPALPISIRTSKGTMHVRCYIGSDWAIYYNPTNCPRIWIETNI